MAETSRSPFGAQLAGALTCEQLLCVAGLAAGYAAAGAGHVAGTEISALAEDPDPVGLAVRLTYRVLLVGAADGLPQHESAALAQHLLLGAAWDPATHAHARATIAVAEAHCPVDERAAAALLDPSAAASAGLSWLDLIDGSCAALRAALTTVSGSRLATGHTAQLLARAAAVEIG